MHEIMRSIGDCLLMCGRYFRRNYRVRRKPTSCKATLVKISRVLLSLQLVFRNFIQPLLLKCLRAFETINVHIVLENAKTKIMRSLFDLPFTMTRTGQIPIPDGRAARALVMRTDAQLSLFSIVPEVSRSSTNTSNSTSLKMNGEVIHFLLVSPYQ
eukprot:GEMP01099069.1.p2 GENE.GEMP01099069.1~~GEMP01099069.1.p2  ORF type:complete len:156 (-),score=11.22 GEMP01099069.1:17-484(-)